MYAGEWAASVAAGAAVISVVFSGMSWWSSRQSKEAKSEATNQANRATTAAEKAATAHQQTADASTRVADAMERGFSDAEDKPWRVEDRGGGEADWHLVNTTTAPKYTVSIEGEPVRGGTGCESVDLGEIDGHESKWLDLYVVAQTEDRTITVRWRTDTKRATKRSFGEDNYLQPLKTQRIELP
ncbi:hypothetical protein ACXDF8_02725 [Mycolicibacterium sp. CBM1]